MILWFYNSIILISLSHFSLGFECTVLFIMLLKQCQGLSKQDLNCEWDAQEVALQHPDTSRNALHIFSTILNKCSCSRLRPPLWFHTVGYGCGWLHWQVMILESSALLLKQSYIGLTCSTHLRMTFIYPFVFFLWCRALPFLWHSFLWDCLWDELWNNNKKPNLTRKCPTVNQRQKLGKLAVPA